MGVAGLFTNRVKMPSILFEEIIGRKVLSATKPSIGKCAIFFVELKIPPVGMYGGYHGVFRMDH